jgi:hypothetical protein
VLSRRRRIVSRQRFDADHIMDDRIIGAQLERRLQLGEHVAAAALLLRLRGASEMLLDGGSHNGRRRLNEPLVKGGLRGSGSLPKKRQMAPGAPALPDLIGDGRWLAHRYDEANDTVQFRFVPREAQRELTFLTDQEIGEAPLAIYSRADCLAEARTRELPTPRLILHSAYCCSTLLARAFDVPGRSFGLKEPQILNDVVGFQRRGGDRRQVAAAMDIALLLLARPLGPSEANVIKPSNLLNPFIPLITALRPAIRGLLLHAPLGAFLGSIARKEIEGRAWVRELMWSLIELGQVRRFGFTEEELYRQTDLQVAALGWLAQQASFAEATQRHSGFRTLDSETLVARPAECLSALEGLFELGTDPQEVAAGPAFRTHSKDRREYSAEERTRERERGQSLHAREIEMVLEWAERVADHADIPMSLPAPLVERSP